MKILKFTGVVLAVAALAVCGMLFTACNKTDDLSDNGGGVTANTVTDGFLQSDSGNYRVYYEYDGLSMGKKYCAGYIDLNFHDETADLYFYLNLESGKSGTLKYVGENDIPFGEIAGGDENIKTYMAELSKDKLSKKMSFKLKIGKMPFEASFGVELATYEAVSA